MAYQYAPNFDYPQIEQGLDFGGNHRIGDPLEPVAPARGASANGVNSEADMLSGIALRYKRQFEEVNQELQDIVSEREKTKERQAITPIANALFTDSCLPRSTRAEGRGIVRAAGLDVKIQFLLAEHDRRKLPGVESTDIYPTDTVEACAMKRSRDRDFEAFKQICLVVPRFVAQITNVRKETLDDMHRYFMQLESGSKSARGDDLSGLRKMVGHKLNADQAPPRTHYFPPEERTGCGLQNDMTGRLLCPIEFDWDNASIKVLLRKHDDPSYDVNSSYFICFLYQGQEGDPEDVEKGFLYSEWIVRGLRHVFTSPSSVFQSTTERENEPPAKKARKKPTKQTVAQLMGMKHVTPRAIAYIAVLIHFSLTDAENWCIDYNGFNYLGFYNTIVDYFETATPDTDEYDHMQGILAWYDRQVFPMHAKDSLTSKPSTAFGDKLARQRAAKTSSRTPRVRRRGITQTAHHGAEEAGVSE
ncbi:hypothetical protein CCMSSC00406_0003127 [Pleurotus cornucopiae]|uniref:Uncharacterized protein n=1 Tax=Pleurotus cornucopiae TaxID=5321 RepID=A0ACB7J748_PLECO|nr:hypothetical protein CCMSSC00406_0003127 [Pleurotus cornucopiae]